MSQLPPEPPTLDEPALTDQASGSTEFQRVLLPWADLNAQSPPASFMQLGKDLLPVLAVLAGMGPDQPHLLTTDTLARLVTATSLSNADRLKAPALNGTTQVTPLTPNLFPPGVSFYLGPADGNLAAALSGPYLVIRNDAGVATCLPAVIGDYAIGDIMLAVPTIAEAPAPSLGGGSGPPFELLPQPLLPLAVYPVGGPYGPAPIFNRFGAKGIMVFAEIGAPSAGNFSLILNTSDALGNVQQTLTSILNVPDIGTLIAVYPGAAQPPFINAHVGAWFRIALDVNAAPIEMSVNYVLLL